MITEEQVRDALREVYDPEVSLSVQDLGLIYEVKINDSEVYIKHSLTSMMCPFAEEICEGIEEAVGAIHGVTKVIRELVFDPPFTVEMVPDEIRMVMGWY
jgi:metal-sulfur cluster biosynthetic enzyme